jgi:hypothetical protein
MRLPPTVKLTLFFSAFNGFSSATTRRYVAWRPGGRSVWRMKHMVLVPSGMCGWTPCARRPISAAQPVFSVRAEAKLGVGEGRTGDGVQDRVGSMPECVGLKVGCWAATIRRGLWGIGLECLLVCWLAGASRVRIGGRVVEGWRGRDKVGYGSWRCTGRGARGSSTRGVGRLGCWGRCGSCDRSRCGWRPLRFLSRSPAFTHVACLRFVSHCSLLFLHPRKWCSSGLNRRWDHPRFYGRGFGRSRCGRRIDISENGGQFSQGVALRVCEWGCGAGCGWMEQRLQKIFCSASSVDEAAGMVTLVGYHASVSEMRSALVSQIHTR